jgi:hypothetical protein
VVADDLRVPPRPEPGQAGSQLAGSQRRASLTVRIWNGRRRTSNPP